MKIAMKKADKEWAIKVKERDDYTCQAPGCGHAFLEGGRQGLHAHHLFGRSRRTTRHMLANGISLCMGHHLAAHSNPLEFHEWMRERLGADEYDDLRRLSLQTKGGLR